MIRFLADNLPRPFRIKPAAAFDEIRDELRRSIESIRVSLESIPVSLEKDIVFRGGMTDVPVDFGFEPRSLRIGYIEGKLSPGVAVTAAATATGGDRTKLWEWNGTDVSQFEAAADFNGSTVTAMGTPSLSVVADSTVPGGNVLRLTAGGSPAGYAAAHWLVLATESTLTYPNRYRWEWGLRATQPLYGGLSFFANPATDHYYGIQCFTNNGSRHRVDAGSVIDFLGGGTNSALSSSSSQDTTGWVELWGETRAAAAPRFELTGFGITGQSSPLGFNHADSGANDGTWQASGTVPPSSWNGLAANRWGLSLVSQSAGAAGNLDLSRLALYRLGDDAAAVTTEASVTTEPPGLSLTWKPLRDAQGRRGAIIEAISGLVTGTDYKIRLIAEGRTR